MGWQVGIFWLFGPFKTNMVGKCQFGILALGLVRMAALHFFVYQKLLFSFTAFALDFRVSDHGFVFYLRYSCLGWVWAQ